MALNQKDRRYCLSLSIYRVGEIVGRSRWASRGFTGRTPPLEADCTSSLIMKNPASVALSNSHWARGQLRSVHPVRHHVSPDEEAVLLWSVCTTVSTLSPSAGCRTDLRSASQLNRCRQLQIQGRSCQRVLGGSSDSNSGLLR